MQIYQSNTQFSTSSLSGCLKAAYKAYKENNNDKNKIVTQIHNIKDKNHIWEYESVISETGEKR